MNNTILVNKIIDDSFSPVSGRKLGKDVKKIGVDKEIVLDFTGIAPFTSLFFNAMFAELTGLGNLSNLKTNIVIVNLDKDDLETYERCLDNAIKKQ